ncbi:MAG: hypothetical protein FWG49_00655 [Leptospirales bacterium]|nr:hypothetical protein [Leptospirales bacterium]
MFDIREYYYSSAGSGNSIEYNTTDIDDEITSYIDTLLIDSVDSLYLCDRYKHNDSIIEIIYPRQGYPKNQTLIFTPDRLRFLLSFYPYKGDFSKVNKIVLRPRYFEAGNIELSSIYLKKKKVLVLYITHPLGYTGSSGENNKFISVSLENIMDTKVIKDSIDRSGTHKNRIPYLWNILATINPDGKEDMEKFFIKMDKVDSVVYPLLNDISYFYSRHGY